MQTTDDMALLREYATGNSEAAFAELVSHRVNFVYSMALRQLRDPFLAEEVTQAVFVILAQKSGRISDKTILTGWLFKTTRFAVLTQIRAAAKRQRYEKEFQMQAEQTFQGTAADNTWEQISPMLDSALAHLSEKDRQAVLLRYFQNKSLSEVGNSLGTGGDTARKRISRALEKLRKYFCKRGVVSTTAIIAGAISTNSVQAAPVALAKMVNAAALAKGATTALPALLIVKETLSKMLWAKLKATALTGIGIPVVSTVIFLAISPVLKPATAANEQHARIERYDFKAGPVKYIYPPGSSNPINLVANSENSVLSPNEPVLTAEFSWQTDAAHPAVNVIRVAVADGQGNEFDPGVNDAAGIEKKGGRHYWASEVPVFPRRGKEIRLRLIGDGNSFADLRIPNPARGPYPVWKAQPLPVSASEDGLEVTLVKFLAEQNVTNEDHSPRTECFFAIRQNSQVTHDWMPVSFEVSDATGNDWVPCPWVGENPYHSSVENGLVRSSFLGALWSGESAWKLRVGFKRTANFPEGDLVRFANLQIPDADEITQPRLRYERNGTDLELAYVIGKTVPFQRTTRLNAERKKGCVTILVSGKVLSRKRRLTFVRATDNRGRPVKLEAFDGPATPSSERFEPFSFVFKPSEDASELNMIVAVSGSRFFDFLAKPDQVGASHGTQATLRRNPTGEVQAPQ